VLPGASTPTEIMTARADGIGTIKFFPADLLGGAAAIAVLAEVFPDIGFVPSGGVGPANVAAYLALDAVPAISGSWMVRRDLLRAGDLDRIRQLSSEAVEQVQVALAGRASS
jgi:2-dehydro-3-deoxyphosphogluconate aldolase/(4S)-4-hydroxy-2-oxoglutarate aldolase